jgi:hypothetical protein
MLRTLSLFVCAVLSSITLVAATGPQVIVTDAPEGMGQVGGGALAGDNFTLANAGPGDASISISQKGGFFSVSPTSFTLAEGATRTVTIRSTTQQNGVSGGSVSILTAGAAQPITLAIRLFVGSQPAGTVSPVPSGPVAVVGLPNEPHSGLIAVSNRGSVGMQGILVADVPWILPQSNVIGIPANGRSGGPFVVDPSRRPDGESALGAIIGTLSYVYLNGTSNTSASEVNAAAAPPSGRVSVSVLEISKPAAAPGQPAPLNLNEVAFFLAGLSGRDGAATDLFLSNRTATSIPNLKLYYTPSGAPVTSSLLASVPQLASNISAWFPSAPQLLFNAFAQIGTLQVRNPSAANVSLTAILSISPDLIANYLTALPVLRSDRGGTSLLFSGVEKTTTSRTNFTLQEISGNAGTVTIDFLGANGSPVGAPRSESLNAFGLLTLEDAAPAGAAAAQVTAGGAARIDGYATVVDNRTLDSWIIPDPRFRGGSILDSETMIAPLPSLPSSASAKFFVTGNATVSLIGGRRRHAVRTKAYADGESVTASANETKTIAFPAGTAGYLRITGGLGAFTMSGRVTANKTGGGAFGGAIPVRLAIDGVSAGASRRVSGVDDPLSGPHPALTLIESSGSPVNARVTVKFTFNAGATVTGQIAASKDFALSSGQMLTIADVVGAVVGPGRGTLGDLSRVVIDVEVTSGAGRVLPFVQTVEPASGDIMIISE